MPSKSALSQFARERVARATATKLQRVRLASSVRRAKGKTKLRTSTKTKSIHRRATELPNRVGSESHFSIKLRPVGLLNRVSRKLVDNTFMFNTDSVFTCAAGAQGVKQLTTAFGPADIRSCMSGAFANAGHTIDSAEFELFMKNSHYEIMIQNSSNAVARLQLWDFMAKRDMYQGPDGGSPSVDAVFDKGLQFQTTGVPTGQSAIVGARPTDSTMLNQYWKAKRVTYIELAPGQVHYHRVDYRINRRINNVIASLNNSAVVALKGWTIQTMLLFYGEPVGDNVGGCTTEAVRFNVVGAGSIHYTYNDNATSYTTKSNNILGTTTGNLENLVTGATAAYAAVI